ncbi:MAG: crossover junction endodeoxyribonuclease RuvC [Candidatus Saccharimonadales bacterium]|nr:crossover junction endodeoxyribonuclease RuvC [Candidatus Saccharimonadales bacterium]
MKILGIDPGTAITGFGVIESDGQKHKLIDAGVIRTPAKQADELRLETIFDDLAELIKSHKPDHCAVEQLFFAQNVTTAMAVSQARGVILLAIIKAGLDHSEYTPLQIKQALTGYGRADKRQIQEMVRVMLGLKSVPKPDDAADALAVAITHANSVISRG